MVSEKYSYISRIPPETDIEDLKEGFENIPSDKVHIYKNAELTEEVLNGYIATGMTIKFDISDKKYTLLVVGDLNRDGILNQIDLKFVIGHIVGLKKYKLEDKNLIVADINNDGDVNQLDLKPYVDYILYQKLNIQKVVKSIKPKIEITDGEMTEAKWYNTYPWIKISKEEETKEEELVYKVKGKTEDGKEIDTDEVKVPDNEISMQLTKDGEYTLTAYTYSKEGAKSDKATLELKLDTVAPKIIAFGPSMYGVSSLDIYISAKDTLSGISKYKIKYGKESTNLDQEITKTIDGQKENKEYIKIDNIEQNTKYYFKIEVEDSAGIKAETDVIEIFSTPSKPSIIVDNKDIWTQSKDVLIVAKEGDEIWYTLDGTDPKTSSSSQKTGTSEKAVFTVNNKCEIKAVYVNTADKSKLSEVETIRVEKIDTKLPEINRFLVKNCLKNKIELNIEAIDEESKIKEIAIRYGTERDNINKTVYINPNEDGNYAGTAIIDNLDAGTKYFIRLEIKDNAGNKEVSDIISDWTIPEETAIVISEESTWEKSKTVTIYGKEGHEIWYTLDETNPKTSNTVIKVNANEDVEFTVDKNLEIQAIYVNASDNSKTSDIKFARVKRVDNTAPKTAKLTLVSNSSDKIQVRAEGVDEESGLHLYTFKYSETSPTEGFKTFTSLPGDAETKDCTYCAKPNTTYYLKVIVSDKAYNETESNVITVKTKHEGPQIVIDDEDSWKQAKTVTIKFPYEQTDTNKYYIRCKFADHDTYIVRRRKL